MLKETFQKASSLPARTMEQTRRNLPAFMVPEKWHLLVHVMYLYGTIWINSLALSFFLQNNEAKNKSLKVPTRLPVASTAVSWEDMRLACGGPEFNPALRWLCNRCALYRLGVKVSSLVRWIEYLPCLFHGVRMKIAAIAFPSVRRPMSVTSHLLLTCPWSLDLLKELRTR